MNTMRLKEAEKKFLIENPDGFANEELQEIVKRHRMQDMIELVKKDFSKAAFEDVETLLKNAARFVGKSSLVSMFEKPKYKECLTSLSTKEKGRFADALYESLHGSYETGFDLQLEILGRRKLAKWTLITVLPNYYRPKRDLLIKPTTTKLIINKLELDLKYKPTPSWAFYKQYRKEINAMKKLVDSSLCPSNIAFCGFLMMQLQEPAAKG